MSSNKSISYSPRRIATGVSCGRAAAHGRYKGGTESTIGLKVGTSVDKIIHDFFKYDIYISCPELDYTIINTPPNTETTTPDYEITFQLEVDGQKFHVLGYADIVFDEYIVEIKTGKQQRWHEIQALCYAVALNRPCRIMYVTKFFYIEVEPDLKKLKSLIKQAWENEQARSVERCEFCPYCPLKVGCDAWNNRNSLLRAVVGLKESIDKSIVPQEDQKNIEVIYDYLKFVAGKTVDSSSAYQVDGHRVTASDRESFAIKEIKEHPIPNPKKKVVDKKNKETRTSLRITNLLDKE